MRLSPPILQCLQLECLLSRFPSRLMHVQGISLRRLLEIDVISKGLSPKQVIYLTIAPNGITGPLKGVPNTLSYGVNPIRQEILNISQIAETFRGIRPPFVIQTGLRTSHRASLTCPQKNSLLGQLLSPLGRMAVFLCPSRPSDPRSSAHLLADSCTVFLTPIAGCDRVTVSRSNE